MVLSALLRVAAPQVADAPFAPAIPSGDGAVTPVIVPAVVSDAVMVTLIVPGAVSSTGVVLNDTLVVGPGLPARVQLTVSVGRLDAFSRDVYLTSLVSVPVEMRAKPRLATLLLTQSFTALVTLSVLAPVVLGVIVPSEAAL